MYTTVDKNALYQSGMEAAGALDSTDIPEQAKIVLDMAEGMLDLRNGLDALADTL